MSRNETVATAGPPPPIEVLAIETARQRSGEFIVASPEGEVHVFLQAGRVAWATDSTHPFEFTRELKRRCDIDDEAFRDVVEECRRQRSQLGQMLVGWGLCSLEDVRDALRHQIRLALATLKRARVGATLFLVRERFSTYDERLTFELDELLRELEALPAGETAELSATPPPPSAGARVSSELPAVAPSSLELPAAVSAARLLEVVKGASWSVVSSREGVDSATRGPTPSLSTELARCTLQDGADFVALRAADGCVVGVGLSGGAHGWCLLESDRVFRASFAALSSSGLVAGLSKTRARKGETPIAWRDGSLGADRMGELEQVFAYGSEILAVIVLGPDGSSLGGVGRSDMTSEDAVATALRRRRALSVSLEDTGAAPLAALGFRMRSMVTGEPTAWCFGAETAPGGEGETLWVFVAREASQSLGWASLTALLRTCRREPGRGK